MPVVSSFSTLRDRSIATTADDLPPTAAPLGLSYPELQPQMHIRQSRRNCLDAPTSNGKGFKWFFLRQHWQNSV